METVGQLESRLLSRLFNWTPLRRDHWQLCVHVASVEGVRLSDGSIHPDKDEVYPPPE